MQDGRGAGAKAYGEGGWPMADGLWRMPVGTGIEWRLHGGYGDPPYKASFGRTNGSWPMAFGTGIAIGIGIEWRLNGGYGDPPYSVLRPHPWLIAYGLWPCGSNDVVGAIIYPPSADRIGLKTPAGLKGGYGDPPYENPEHPAPGTS